MIRVQVVTLAPLIWWISWGMISLHHANSPLWACGVTTIRLCCYSKSLITSSARSRSFGRFTYLSACLSYHCSHSCYPPLFNSEITWINCKAKTGWPILWWSSWTEKGERERVKYSGKTHCYVPELSEGFFSLLCSDTSGLLFLRWNVFRLWQIFVIVSQTVVFMARRHCLTHKKCKWILLQRWLDCLLAC